MTKNICCARLCCPTATSRTSHRTGTTASTCPRCWTTAGTASKSIFTRIYIYILYLYLYLQLSTGPGWCRTGSASTPPTGRTTCGGRWRSRRGSSGYPWCSSQTTSPGKRKILGSICWVNKKYLQPAPGRAVGDDLPVVLHEGGGQSRLLQHAQLGQEPDPQLQNQQLSGESLSTSLSMSPSTLHLSKLYRPYSSQPDLGSVILNT